jgi:hypothetical protein
MEKERNKIKLKVKEKKISGFDSYLSIALKVIGILFLGIAGYYFIDAQGEDLITKIISFLTAPEVIANGEATFNWGLFSCLLTSHIVGISGLIWAIYYSRNHLNKAYRFTLSIVITMPLINAIIYVYWYFSIWAFLYYNYYIASAFLVVTLIPFFINYKIYKRKSLLSAILIYFHIFMLEMLADSLNENRYLYVFSAISIFTLVLFYISKRDKPYLSLFLNGIFAYGFLMILVLKKFVFNTNASFLSLFFIVSFIYFALFYGITLYYSIKENKKIFSIINVLNTIVYIVLNGYVLSRFGYSNYLGSILFIAFVVHLSSIIIYYKYYFQKGKLITNEIASLVLFSASVSLIRNEYSISVFFGIISLLFFGYAKIYKNKNFVNIVIIALITLSANFVYLTINSYFILLNSPSFGINSIIQKVFLNSLIILLFIFLLRIIVIKETQEEEQNWFNRRRYIRYLNILSAITSFVFIEWLGFFLLYSTVYDFAFSNKILIVIGSLFALFILKNDNYFSKKIKNWIYLSVYFFAIFVISQIHLNFSFTSIEYIVSNNITLLEVVIHYIELFLALSIFAISFIRFYYQNIGKRRKMTQFFVFTLYFIINFAICKEYDYITVLSSISSSRISGDEFQMILRSNQFLPYSMIILTCASILLIVGIKLKSLFLRSVSIIIIGADLVKIFFIEFIEISDNYKGVVFIVIGALLLLLSWFYNKTKYRRKRRISRKS